MSILKIKKKMIIVIPFGLPWDWSADYECRTAEFLSKHNKVIAYLPGEGISLQNFFRHHPLIVDRPNQNLLIFRPIYILPFQRIPFISKINFFLSSVQLNILLTAVNFRQKRNIIYWSFSLQHTLFPNQVKNRLLSIYDCVDAYISEDHEVQKQWTAYETHILKEVDMVLANSRVLYKSLKPKHTHVFEIPEGLFALDIYGNITRYRKPEDLINIPKPRIAFIGNINSRLDFDLLNTLVKQTPKYSYVFIGQIDPNFDGLIGVNFEKEIKILQKHPNVYFLGQKEKMEIPHYIKYVDLGFIPYDVRLPFNAYCNPMKIQEFFYMGKPLICTPIPAVMKYRPNILIMNNANDAKQSIQKTINTRWLRQKEQKRIAIENSVENKILVVSKIIKSEFDISL